METEAGQGPRDRDPPPGGMETSQRQLGKAFLRDLELWEAITDLPKSKRGIKLVQALTGPAKEAVRSLAVSDLVSDDASRRW